MQTVPLGTVEYILNWGQGINQILKVKKTTRDLQYTCSIGLPFIADPMGNILAYGDFSTLRVEAVL
jgi:hypothetical protein